VRRRRLGALAALAALAAVGGAAVGAGGEKDPGEPATALPPACLGSDATAWGRLAGQRLIVRTDGTPDDTLLRRAKRGEIAGVIVFPSLGGSEAGIRRGLRRLQAAARAGGQAPLIVSTDQEGGAVKRFPDGPPLLSPGQLAESGDRQDARLEGRATGNFLSELGINTDLAPVLDVPASSASVIATRAFGADVESAAELGLFFADGLTRQGVLATAKHFPGLGRATLNTDFSPSEVTATRREMARDLAPFEAAIADRLPLIMVALASYPELGAKGPAALERSIATRLLRTQLGFEGVSITDDLEAEAVAARYDATEAAQRAAAAGMDLLLFARGPAPGVLRRLERALASGRLDPEAARESCARIVALREALSP